jgi:hypothetical protein
VRDGHDPTEQVADRLRALADEPIRPEIRDRHLLRLRTHEPSRRSARAVSSAGERGWRRRLAPLTAAATAIVLFGGGGTVVAAQDAAPDEALYGVKRASEQLWIGLPRGRGEAADVQLAMAERRLEEARRAPAHAPRLVEEGADNAEAAAEERPEEAIAAFGRLLGDGADRLPDQASPRAREVLHRNCVRIAEKHDLSDAPCGAAPEASGRPGRGRGSEVGRGRGSEVGRAHGRDGAPGQLGKPEKQDRPDRGERPDAGGRPEQGGRPDAGGRPDEGGRPGTDSGGKPGRGWGPGGRPDGVVGPPPDIPGGGRGAADQEDTAD